MTQTKKHPRIFMGFKEVAGHYTALKRGFDVLGVPTTWAELSNHRFQYATTPKPAWLRAMHWLTHKRGREWRTAEIAARWLLLFWAMATHDVFIFSFGRSFFTDARDLPVLKRFGKKILFQYHGSDSRPPYLDGTVIGPTRDTNIETCIAMTRRRKWDVARVDRYADIVIDTPTQGLFRQKPFVNLAYLGLSNQPARPLEQHPSAVKAPGDNTLRILHCPSDPAVKGTALIRRTVAAVEATLNAKGLRIQYLEITGQPNHVVLEALAHCDLVLDQAYADFPMPGFPTEAAWYGKPVLLAGYAHALWKDLLCDEDLPPTYYCHPDDLEASLLFLAEHPEARHALGARAQAYVQSRWQPQQIAERYLQLLAGDIPPAWRVDPKQLTYTHGVGLSETDVRETIAQMIETGGFSVLQLDDKPELLKAMAYLAAQAPEKQATPVLM